MKLNIQPDVTIESKDEGKPLGKVASIRNTISSEGWQYLLDEYAEREKKLIEQLIYEKDEKERSILQGKIQEGRYRIRGLIDSILGRI